MSAYDLFADTQRQSLEMKSPIQISMDASRFVRGRRWKSREPVEFKFQIRPL